MRLLANVSALLAAILLSATLVNAAEPENTMIITLDGGEVVIGLRPDLAPKHVEQIKSLVRSKDYDNVVFHRVIDGFMAQTGDVEFGDSENNYQPGRAGTGGSKLGNLPAEFTGEPFKRGVVGMARGANPNSANSQFFIMFAPAPGLNGQYTVIGEVESGMEHVDKIKRGDAAANGVVREPDRMLKVEILADRK